MTNSLTPPDELATALGACLALPTAPDLLDPQLLQRAHELLDTLRTTPPDAATYAQISQIMETGSAAVHRRHGDLHHEHDTLTSLINKNREVANRLEQILQTDQHLSQEAWKSFNIARKLIARQSGILLSYLDNEQIERLVAKNLQEILRSRTTGALTQAMHSLVSDASDFLDNFELQNRPLMRIVEAVYARFNQLLDFKLAPPQISELEIYRQDLQRLGELTTEFCRRPINLITNKTSLAMKFGNEIVKPLRDLFAQLKIETDGWLRYLSVPVQEQIQKQKIALEKREADISMIRGQITILETRKQETKAALARLQQQEALIERTLMLAQTIPFAKPPR